MSKQQSESHTEERSHVASPHPWWPPRLNLVGALAVAIGTACLIVSVAYWMYWTNSNRKYDIDRGGGQAKNQALSVEDDEADTTSPVDAPTAKRKIEYLVKEVTALGGLSKFDPNDLSDQSIQLTPAEQPSL